MIYSAVLLIIMILFAINCNIFKEIKNCGKKELRIEENGIELKENLIIPNKL